MTNKYWEMIRWIHCRCINYCTYHFRKVKLGKNVKTRGLIMVRGRGQIEIGNNVCINSSRDSNPIGGDTKTIFYVQRGGKLIIGKDTGISNSAIYSESEINIGEAVLIGGSCKIYDSDFHSINYDERISGHDINYGKKPINIKNGAFIGAHCTILKGVTIGEKSVIGAGSVVTKDVPDGELWAGNPAHFIKKLYI